jgi:hypothetical protein
MILCGMLDLCRIIFGIAVALFRPRAALEGEILVLRQQIIGVTAQPTAEWIANQLTAACWEQVPRYLVRDRDACYGELFVRRVRSLGIRDHYLGRMDMRSA